MVELLCDTNNNNKSRRVRKARRHSVMRQRWRLLWWMLKTAKTFRFRHLTLRVLGFSLSSRFLALHVSAPNAFVVRMSPHWKWWLVHTSATLRLGIDYFRYYYCELMVALIVPEPNTYFFIAAKTKTIRDIYVECTKERRKNVHKSHRIVSHASVWFYGLFGT